MLRWTMKPVQGARAGLAMILALASAAAGHAEIQDPIQGPIQAPIQVNDWPSQIKTCDRLAWSRTVTSCDRLAAHPDDPVKVADGVARSAMDIPAAITACVAAVAADPDNPRINDQWARAYGYAGRHQDAAPFREKALMSDYPQSLFVAGFTMITRRGGAAADPCTGGALVRLSALAGCKAGRIGYRLHVVNGVLAPCRTIIDKAERTVFLERDTAMLNGY